MLVNLSRFVPLLAAFGLSVCHFALQVIFTWARLTPLIYELREAFDGSAELAAQGNAILRIRRWGTLCRGLSLILAGVAVFMQPPLVRALFFVLFALFCFLLLVEFSFILSDRDMRFVRRPVLMSLLVEVLYALIYFLVFSRIFPDGLATAISFLPGR